MSEIIFTFVFDSETKEFALHIEHEEGIRDAQEMVPPIKALRDFCSEFVVEANLANLEVIEGPYVKH
jgi:hypothetical protein|tara:strand:- start:2766 stop:2966 length:201 start_codon:yes stop_codon:yes gene_type:complete